MTNKALTLCADLYRVRQEIEQATKQIGDALDCCLNRVANAAKDAHLSLAYATWVDDGGTYLPKKCRNTDAGITALLSKGGDMECPHCLRAHQLVLHRKALKKKRGAIRRSITMIGKAAAQPHSQA